MKWIQTNRGTTLFWLVVAFLFVLPFVYESRNLMILLTQIFIFSIFAMSYDLLLGYTGIVSFGHAMFFGIGAYSIGIFMKRFEPTMVHFLLALVATLVLTAVISFIVGLLTLRLKSHFYAMLTLSLSGLFLVLAEKWRSLTFGNDGFTFQDSRAIYRPIALLLALLGSNDRSIYASEAIYQFSVGAGAPVIRENEQRTESLGFQVLHYKIAASVVSGILAGVAGILYAMSLRFVNTSVFSMDITLDALLMTIIGGVGTLYGAMIGAGLIEFAHDWLTELAKEHVLFERWIIFFGIIYILVVMFFPKGIVGTLRTVTFKRKKQKPVKKAEKLAG